MSNKITMTDFQANFSVVAPEISLPESFEFNHQKVAQQDSTEKQELLVFQWYTKH